MRLIDNIANAERCEHAKIKTHFAKIIVGGTCEKPCYEIMYFDPTDRKYHIGFGSLCLEYVFKWLEDEFEITAEAPTIEARPVVRGEWEQRKDVIGFVRCSVCKDCNVYDDWADGKKWKFCPNCGADMRGEEDGKD